MEVGVIFDHVTCVYVWQIYREKLGGSRWSFSWLRQEIKVLVSPFARSACLSSERRGHRCPIRCLCSGSMD